MSFSVSKCILPTHLHRCCAANDGKAHPAVWYYDYITVTNTVTDEIEMYSFFGAIKEEEERHTFSQSPWKYCTHGSLSNEWKSIGDVGRLLCALNLAVLQRVGRSPSDDTATEAISSPCWVSPALMFMFSSDRGISQNWINTAYITA